MRHIKELLENKPKIGEVDTGAYDYQAHRSLRAMAASIGTPAVRLAMLAAPAEQAVTRVEAEARRFAPQLARWIVDEELETVLSPEWLTTKMVHRVAGKAVMSAAIHAANVTGRKIDVLAGHGAVPVPGDWTVESDMDSGATSDGPATSYSLHRVNPGIITSKSTEWFFGLPSEE